MGKRNIEQEQKLSSLLKELNGVRAETKITRAAIREGIFEFDKATKRGDLLRELKQKEKEIIRKIQDITKEEEIA